MWFDNFKKDKVNKLQTMARAAEGYGGETFWLPEGLDIVFLNKQDRDSWSADFVFETEIKFREELDDRGVGYNKEPRYWAFIKYEDKIGERDAGDIEVDLPQPGEKALWGLKRPKWQRENM